jgi:hypothetical protein
MQSAWGSLGTRIKPERTPPTILLYQPWFPAGDGATWFGRLADVSPSPKGITELDAPSENAQYSSHSVFAGLCQPSNVGLSYLVSSHPAFYMDGTAEEREIAKDKLFKARVKAANKTTAERLDQVAMQAFESWRKLEIAATFDTNHQTRYPSVVARLQSNRKSFPGWGNAYIHQTPLKLPLNRLRMLASGHLKEPRLGTMYFLTDNLDLSEEQGGLPAFQDVEAAAQEVADMLLRVRLELVVGAPALAALKAMGQASFFASPPEDLKKTEKWATFHSLLKKPQVIELFDRIATVAARIWVNADYLWPVQYTTSSTTELRGKSPLHRVATNLWQDSRRHTDSQRREVVLTLLDMFIFETNARHTSALACLAGRVLDLAYLDDELSSTKSSAGAFSRLQELLDPTKDENKRTKSSGSYGCTKIRRCGLHAGFQNPWSNMVAAPKLLKLLCEATENHAKHRSTWHSDE